MALEVERGWIVGVHPGVENPAARAAQERPK